MDEQFINELAVVLRKVGTIHTVGEEWHSYTGEIPVGGVPYCGQMVVRSTYSALWAYAQERGLVKTEAEWQQLATTNNGNVPYYSDGDGSTTFRMPKIVGYVKGASSQSVAGDYVAEGLPNITSDLSTSVMTGNGNLGTEFNTGAMSLFTSASNYWNITTSNANKPYAQIAFDASRSNEIYGNSSHVTPETSTVMFGVYAFGAVINTAEVDVFELSQNRIPVTGLRGQLAGYETVGASTIIDGNAPDSNETGSAITVSNGIDGTSWTKTVRVTAEVAVTLGDKWVWQNGEQPTITAGGILVCIWCGSGGIVGFISP